MKSLPRTVSVAIVLLGFFAACKKEQASEWKPVEGRIMTRWAAEVRPDSVLPEPPRPQIVRRDWLNLNGLWDYAIADKEAGLRSFPSAVLRSETSTKAGPSTVTTGFWKSSLTSPPMYSRSQGWWLLLPPHKPEAPA